MLSDRFEHAVYKILDDQNVYIDHKNDNFEMHSSCDDLFQGLRELSLHCILNSKDANDYENYICKGILDKTVLNNRKMHIDNIHIHNLQRINHMTKESQFIISQCIDALNVDHEVDTETYENIKNNKDNYIQKAQTTFLLMHHITMMRIIFLIWETDNALYVKDIMQFIEYAKPLDELFPQGSWSTQLPIYNFTKLKSLYQCFTNPNIKFENIYSLIQFMESLIKKYKDIDVFNQLKQRIAEEKLARKKVTEDALAKDFAEELTRKLNNEITKGMKSSEPIQKYERMCNLF